MELLIPRSLQIALLFISKNRRRFIAEIVGTYILVFIHAGTAIAASWFPDSDPDTRLTFTGQVLATGLSLTFLIYEFVDISGAHFNPNVSLAFFLRREVPFQLFVPYVISQFIGCYSAAATLYELFGTSESLMGANRAVGISLFPQAWIIEMLCTSMLILLILRAVNRGSAIEREAAIAVGTTIPVLTCFGGNFGVGSMNMIRTLSIATFSNELTSAGVFLSAQLVGVMVAIVLSSILDNPSHEEQVRLVVGRHGAIDDEQDHASI